MVGLFRKWFTAREKDQQKVNNIDLNCDYKRIRGDNSKSLLPTTNHQLDFHGYTLKIYF